MDDVIFVSVCFGDPRYMEQQKRLMQSILDIYPKANTLFYHNMLPPGSKNFYDSLYGFKVHAIWQAKLKAKRVIFLDPAMILVDKVDDLFKFEMMAVKDDNKLYNLVSNKCYDHFHLTQEEVKEKGWHLVGGSIYYFDFNTQVANEIFAAWYDAERKGIFGSQHEQASEQLQGHRMDEAVMAIVMYMNGVEPVGPDVARYCNGESPMFRKVHFK